MCRTYSGVCGEFRSIDPNCRMINIRFTAENSIACSRSSVIISPFERMSGDAEAIMRVGLLIAGLTLLTVAGLLIRAGAYGDVPFTPGGHYNSRCRRFRRVIEG